MVKIVKKLLFFTVIVCFFAFLIGKPVGLVASADNEKITSARGMCTMETSSGRVLYSKNMHEKMPMASTTKIITAITVLSKIKDLDQKAVIPKQAIKIPGTSIYLEEGESLTIRELLYGLMLRSGNDAAVALAILSCGSVEEFVDYANEFVKTLGAKDTHLVNPHGLDDSRHYTTPYDLAKITAFALQDKNFAEIVKTEDKVISKEFDKNGNKRLLKNKNKLLKNYEYADGVKTGYTSKAGRSFVGSATKDGMQVVCVVLNCKPMFEECEALLKKSFDEYRLVKVLDREERGTVLTKGAKEKIVKVINKREFYYPLKENEINNITIKTNLKNEILAPCDENTVVGEIEVNLGKYLIFSDKIYTIKEVKNNSIKQSLDKVIRDFAS